MISCKNNTNIWFFAFPNFRKVGKFEAAIERRKAKSASGGLCLLTPWPSGALPVDHAGGSDPRPRYRAHHGMRLCPSPRCWGLEPPLPRPTSDNHTQCQGATYCTSLLQDNTSSVASGGLRLLWSVASLLIPGVLSLRGKVLLRV